MAWVHSDMHVQIWEGFEILASEGIAFHGVL